jgi:hypothetical protein
MACASNFDEVDSSENELDSVTNDLEQLNIGLGFVTLSQKKSAQICFEGYYYRKNGEPKNGTHRWRCVTSW